MVFDAFAISRSGSGPASRSLMASFFRST
uniref:Uncharacterized protein n=1 Tax=Rhizophora mucronata TaxID=61149 RepID=A0A2P2NNF3_RHIMU